MQNKKSKFKNKVYETVKKITKGKVMSYKEVARLVGKPQAWRLVGNILSKNKNCKIPCHRVIKSDAKIGGYNQGSKKKEYLLKKEGLVIKKGRVCI